MSGRIESTGLLELPFELLYIIARHNYGDSDATRNACLIAKCLTPVFQEVLLEHIETTSEMNGGIFKIINHMHDLAVADQSSTIPIRNKMMQHASRITSLSIARQIPNSNAIHPLVANCVVANTYALIIRSMHTFGAAQREKWVRDFHHGKDSALVRFLLWLSSSIHTLEVSGTVGSLPRSDFFRRSGALQNLRRLRLSRLAQSRLSVACYHIMALPTMRELEFVGISLRSAGLSRLPNTPLQLKALRFIRCYISPRAVQRLVSICPQLAEFVYKLGRQAWQAGQLGLRRFEVHLIEQHLMMRSATLERFTITNMQVARLDNRFLSGLAGFTALNYLCVNQIYLTPTSDPDHQLLALPSTLRELELYHCQGLKTIGALRHLLSHDQSQFPGLRVLKVRLRRSRHLDTQAIQDEILDLVHCYRVAGMTLSIAIVTSSFRQ